MGLRFRDTPYTLTQFILKRTMDCVGTVLGMVVILPLMGIVALAIRLDSPGPIFFKQKRVGLNGTLFDMYKFRSMYHNVDETLHRQHIAAYVSGQLDVQSGVKLKDDPRVTRVGKFIRRLSIDELPQLFNVLRGEMSLVGPRPLPIYEVEQFDLWHSERLKFLPGMTGLWQVTARSQVSFDDQLRLDIRYIQNYSIWLDIKILLLTIPAVISKRGAG
ncbi:MAG: exopolysaccharide biosynthesis polyprenyl glycosylphosphotransferase [Anaerolineales bacterium]